LERIVIDQEPKIIASEKASGDVLNDVEKGNENLDSAVEHAQTRRRNQRRAILIVLVIVLIAIVVVVTVVVVKKNT